MTAPVSPVVDDIAACIARTHRSRLGRYQSLAVGSCSHVAEQHGIRFTAAALDWLMAEARPEDEPTIERAVPWREFPDFHNAFLEEAVARAAPRRVLDVGDLRPSAP